MADTTAPPKAKRRGAYSAGPGRSPGNRNKKTLALEEATRKAAVSIDGAFEGDAHACLAPNGIRVNAVALGAVMTTNLRAAIHEREELRDEIVGVTPLGRIGEAEEAAEAALFLASPSASFITGQIVVVDGGRLVLDPLASPIR